MSAVAVDSIRLPAPRAQGGHVLYLDFDGVLHPEDVWVRPRGGPYVRTPAGHALFEHAELLEDLLDPYPAVRLVLSTSWVCRYGFTRTVGFLPVRLASRCVGATFHGEMNRYWFDQLTRGAQVHADVHRRMPARWLAVDDCGEGWADADKCVVLSHPVEGLAAPAVLAKLTAALERFSA